MEIAPDEILMPLSEPLTYTVYDDEYGLYQIGASTYTTLTLSSVDRGLCTQDEGDVPDDEIEAHLRGGRTDGGVYNQVANQVANL